MLVLLRKMLISGNTLILHGLEDKIDWIIENEFELVICPDAASYDIECHKRLAEVGIDCLILDHHETDGGYSDYPII